MQFELKLIEDRGRDEGNDHEILRQRREFENPAIWFAAGAPPHVAAGTRHTSFTSNLEEPRSSIAIIGASNICARHFGDVT